MILTQPSSVCFHQQLPKDTKAVTDSPIGVARPDARWAFMVDAVKNKSLSVMFSFFAVASRCAGIPASGSPADHADWISGDVAARTMPSLLCPLRQLRE